MQGWSPRTVTVGADGALLSVTVSDPRFTREEVALLLASRRAERVPRGDHGFPYEQATDPDLQYRWKANLPTTDFAQAALNKAKSAYLKAWPDADADSLLWAVELESPETATG